MSIRALICLIGFIVSGQSYALDICSLEYLGLHNTVNTKSLKQANKLTKLESSLNLIRSLKVNSNAIAIDYSIERQFRKIEHFLLAGEISTPLKKMSSIYDNFELNYLEMSKYREILKFGVKKQEESASELMVTLLQSFKEDKFSLELLSKFSNKHYSSATDLLKDVKLSMQKNERRVGLLFTEYKKTNELLASTYNSNACIDSCKKSILELRSRLGITSGEGKFSAPVFRELKKLKMSEIQATINTSFVAYKYKIFSEGFYEVNDFINEMLVSTRTRKILSRILRKVFPKTKITVRVIDKLLTEAIDVRRNYPLIRVINNRAPHVKEQFSMLKAYNQGVGSEGLLVTFARREDSESIQNWKAMLNYAKENDNNFHRKMLYAENEARLKGKLSAYYDKSPYRLYAIIIFGGLAYQGLTLNFELTEEEVVELDINNDEELLRQLVENAKVDTIIDLTEQIITEKIAIEK